MNYQDILKKANKLIEKGYVDMAFGYVDGCTDTGAINNDERLDIRRSLINELPSVQTVDIRDGDILITFNGISYLKIEDVSDDEVINFFIQPLCGGIQESYVDDKWTHEYLANASIED